MPSRIARADSSATAEIDIEELVGQYRTRTCGACWSTTTLTQIPEPEPLRARPAQRKRAGGRQAETARLAGKWKLGKLNEISDEQAREDLAALVPDDGDRRPLRRRR